MITIYGKPSCGFCTKAKNLCKERNFEYEYKDVSTSMFMEELKEQLPSVKSVPQIWVNGAHVGGYNDFTAYIENTNYTGTGHSL